MLKMTKELRESFATRYATRDDFEAVADLLLQSNRHYWGEKDGAEEMTRATAATLVSGHSDCHLLIGLLGEKFIAFATFAILLPAPNEQGTLFMKDLFVAAEARSAGIGAIMMQRVARIAVERGCQRFDWTAESDNPRALAFYDRLSAQRMTEKQYFRFSGTDLERFASGA